MRFPALVGVLLLVASPCLSAQQPRWRVWPDPAWAGREPAERVCAAFGSIHARLAQIQDEHPELSALADGQLTDMRIEHNREDMSWSMPIDHIGGARLGVKGGFSLRVSVRHPVESEPEPHAMDYRWYFPCARVFYSYVLLPDSANEEQEAFCRAVRRIVEWECTDLAEEFCWARAEDLCKTLTARAGGEWRSGSDNSFLAGHVAVRCHLRDASGENIAYYHILLIGAGVDPYARKALGCWATAHGKVSILGLAPHFTVVELLHGNEGEEVRKARAALVQTLGLAPPKITIETYRAVLSAAEDALDRAHAQAHPDAEPTTMYWIAGGQSAYIEERDGGLRFVWDFKTVAKNGYRVAVQLTTDGEVAVEDVQLGY